MSKQEIKDSILDDLHAVEELLRCSTASTDPFVTNFCHSYGVTSIDHESFFSRHILNAREIIVSDEMVDGRVDKNIHKIWVTDLNNQYDPPAIYVDAIVSDVEVYSSLGWNYC